MKRAGEAAPIAVMGPMACEIDRFCSYLENPVRGMLGGYPTVTGTIDGAPVIAVRTYIGMVNVAAATAQLIAQVHPSAILLQGTSGAHDPALHQFDIVLGEKLFETASVYSPHRDRGAGSRAEDWTFPGAEVPFSGGKAEQKRFLYGDARLLEAAGRVPYSRGRVVRGAIGSGDMWNREIDRLLFFHEQVGSSCEEMEGFSVAQVCAASGTPMLDIRVISNSEFYPDEEFSEETGEVCQDFVLGVVREIIHTGLF